jgi:hypothetical protein
MIVDALLLPSESRRQVLDDSIIDANDGDNDNRFTYRVTL